VSRRVLQSRTGVGTNCKSAFPGARIQGGRRATGLSRLYFNIPSSSQRNAGKEPVRNPYSEYSGTRNIGKYSVNGIHSVSCLSPQIAKQFLSERSCDSNGTLILEIRQRRWKITVDLHHVLAMELIIDPNLGKNQAIAALADWRIAGDVPTGEPLRWCDR
jgi:hypothetical protein